MKDLSEQTHYEVLELAPGCAIEDLAKAYAQAKERYGPGSLATYALAEPGEAEAVLRRVEEAFGVLGNPEQRRTYDSARGFSTPAPPREVPPVGEIRPPDPVEAEPRAPSNAEPRAPIEAEPSAPIAPEPAPPEPAAVAPAPPEAATAPTVAEPETAPELAVASSPIVSPEPVPPELAAAAQTSPEPAPSPVVAEPVPAAETAPEPVAAPSPTVSPEPLPEHKPVRKTESDLPVDSAVTGDALRRVREARGLSLKDVEGRTKIGHWHLENIERERYADLPAQVYLRGFLMSFARELKLDPVRVAKSYLEQMKAKSQAKPE